MCGVEHFGGLAFQTAFNFNVSIFALACVWPGLRKDTVCFEELPEQPRPNACQRKDRNFEVARLERESEALPAAGAKFWQRHYLNLMLPILNFVWPVNVVLPVLHLVLRVLSEVLPILDCV